MVSTVRRRRLVRGREDAGREPEAGKGRKGEREEDETESRFLLRRHLDVVRDSASDQGRWEGGHGIVGDHRQEMVRRGGRMRRERRAFASQALNLHMLFSGFSGWVCHRQRTFDYRRHEITRMSPIENPCPCLEA